MITFLSNIDIYDKYSEEEYRVQTLGGAFLSLFLSMFGTIIFFSQFAEFVIPDFSRDLTVNRTFTDNMEHVNVSMTILFNMPCDFVDVEVSDSLGFSQVYSNTLQFKRLNKFGDFIAFANKSNENSQTCLPCRGIKKQNQCCNSCSEIVMIHKIKNLAFNPEEWEQCKNVDTAKIDPKRENCLIKGKVTVNKVPGVIHFIQGRNLQKNDSRILAKYFENNTFSLTSHYIYRLRFGPKYLATITPLEDLRNIPNLNEVLHVYDIMCTPLIYKKDVITAKTFEYSVLSRYQMNPNMVKKRPGVDFHYQFTPYSITVNWRTRSLTQIISSTFGVLSGGFAITSMLDSFVYKAETKSKQRAKNKSDDQE